MQSYREEFKVPNIVNNITKGTTGAASAVEKETTGVAKNVGKGTLGVTKTVGKGVTSLPNTVKNKVVGPVYDFFKKIWAWFRWVLSVVCCMCLMSCCLSLGIPQMVLGGIGGLVELKNTE